MKRFLPAIAVVIFMLGGSPARAANCVPNPGGNETISASCAFARSVNGADAGSITVTGSGVTLTINAGQTIVVNGGTTSSITITNGAKIAITDTGQMAQGYIWMFDADADGWPSITTQTVADVSPGSGYVRRSGMVNIATADCDDTAYSTTNSCMGGGFLPTVRRVFAAIYSRWTFDLNAFTAAASRG